MKCRNEIPKTIYNGNINFTLLESAIADQQLLAIEQIAALPMSTAESRTIKPIIESIDKLLREWISADKDVTVDSYALKKMQVMFCANFSYLRVNDVDFCSV